MQSDCDKGKDQLLPVLEREITTYTEKDLDYYVLKLKREGWRFLWRRFSVLNEQGDSEYVARFGYGYYNYYKHNRENSLVKDENRKTKKRKKKSK